VPAGKCLRVADGQTELTRVTPAALIRYLGATKVHGEEMLKKDAVGIATGLAWTATGGDVLFVEATAMKGKGQLTLTGSLGEVMKESAQAALSWTRAHSRALGLKEELFGVHDVHVHVPEGAIPKDGPSAGITIATAMISIFTNRLVKRSLAMTGEITLRGNVLPIGGIKEKILAARRAGLTTVVCPKLNQQELEEVPAHVKRGLAFHLVEDVDEVLRLALIPPLEARPVGTKAPPKAFVHRPHRSKPVVV
jgi:ATP-dependent Lon protease